MSLGLRLALMLLAIFAFAGTVAVVNGLRTADRYFQTETQTLGAPIAMYIAERRSPFRDGKFDADRFSDVARSAMILNPAIDIYALDAAGRVLAHGGEDRVLARERIDIAPLRRFLDADRPERLLGDDPRHATRRRVFSAAMAGPPHDPWGYVYVVLDTDARPGLTARPNPEQLRAFASGGLAAILLAGFAGAALLFVRLTRPLRALAREMSTFVADGSRQERARSFGERDEVANLRHSFERLSVRVTEQMQALRQVDSSRREWIAHLSHDLRVPLAALHAHLERALMHDGAASASARREAIARGLLHCDQIRRLLDELFESARLEAPTLELHCETFELTELVQDCVAGFRGVAEGATVQVRCEAETPGAAMVYADIALFERLVDNLLVNAVKASRRGGVVTASVRRSGSVVTLAVTDCGDGPTADMRVVFDEGGEPSIGAAGLGLRIIGRILRLHRLRSGVETSANGGSRVTIEIPAADSSLAVSGR